MKNLQIWGIYIIISLLVIITVIVTYNTYFIHHKVGLSNPEVLNTKKRPVVSDSYIRKYGEPGANPESTLQMRELIRKEAYWINKDIDIHNIYI